LKTHNISWTTTAAFTSQIAQRKLSVSGDPLTKQKVGSSARTSSNNIYGAGTSIFGGATSVTTSVVYHEKFGRLVSYLVYN